MSASESRRIRIDPVTEEVRPLIRKELATLLKNLHFTSSKRYPALLHYVVEKTLDGHADELKERILGIDVFHRPSDYDTNSDTIVRVAAGEVRKRLTLVYHETGEEHAVQIVLPTGSYVPEFFRLAAPESVVRTTPNDASLALMGESPALPAGPTDPHLPEEPAGSRAARWTRPVIGLGLFLLGVALATLLFRPVAPAPATSVDRFWQTMQASSNPTLVCAGALVPSVSGFTEAEKMDDYPYVSVVTAGVLTGLADLFSRNRIHYIVQPASSTTLTDMRLHPTVLIGAYNNKWTVLMLDDLHFRFTAKPVIEIYDSTNLSRTWSRPDSLPYKDKEDYAIVARFHDKLTDNSVIVIAGLGKNGTEAAAQFVTTPRYLDLLSQQSPGWASRNVEIVLKTTVVDSKTGAPSIEAVHVW